MIIDNKDSTYDVMCDGCGEEEALNESNFLDAVEEVKKMGYRFNKVNKDWEHYCPECTKQEDI